MDPKTNFQVYEASLDLNALIPFVIFARIYSQVRKVVETKLAA